MQKYILFALLALLMAVGIFTFVKTNIADVKVSQHSSEKIENNTQVKDELTLLEKNLLFLKNNPLQVEGNNQTQSTYTPIIPSTKPTVLEINSTQIVTLLPKTEENITQPLQPQSSYPKNPPKILNTPAVEEIIHLDTNSSKKPKLAIIIDDIGDMEQYKDVLGIPFKVTQSLFPKSSFNQQTPKIAELLVAQGKPYMIHLPLEAENFYQKEHKWLRVGDSKEKIRETLEQIRKDFPKMRYLNNHTGSKFTANFTTMSYFLDSMNDLGIIFVDSRTTHKTQTQNYYDKNQPQNDKIPYLQRDVFLDNVLERQEILKNLSIAINKAQQKGYAIAIGHPHQITIQTLRESKKLLEDSVELVYINELLDDNK